MTFYERNTSFLSPLIKKEISEVSGNNSNNYNIIETHADTGQPNLQIIIEDRSFFVHDSKDPILEANQWVKDIVPKENTVFIVFGFGLGYHIEALYQKCSDTDNISIVVVEPCKDILNKALRMRDLSTLLGDPNFCLITASTEGSLMKQLENILPIDLVINNSISILLKESLTNNISVYDNYAGKIKRYLINAEVNRNTLIAFSSIWTNNAFENLDSVLESRPIVNLYNKFTDIPVIIVAAGPSLDKNIHLLPKAKGKAVIIAVGTSFKSVCKQGIEPDFVFSIDGAEPQIKMFQDIQFSEPWLCYVPTVYPEVPSLFSKKFLAHTGVSLSWLTLLTGEVGKLEGGPSVANFAFEFANKIGGNPIIFLGQDLALSDNRTHATNTIHENNVVVDTTDLVEVEGIDGSKVLTRRDFHSMLSSFQLKIEQLSDNVKIIDATEGGARILGTEVMRFSDVIENYLDKEYPISHLIHQHAGTQIIENIDSYELERYIDNTIAEVAEVKSIARKGERLSIDFQAMFAENRINERKLAKLYDGIIDALKKIRTMEYFCSAAALVISYTNIILAEATKEAKKYPYLSPDWGSVSARGYQRYFEEIRKACEIDELLKNTLEQISL